MKAKTLRRFIDKETNAVHELNSVFDCSEERFSELQKAGNFVNEVYETTKDKKVKDETKEVETESSK